MTYFIQKINNLKWLQAIGISYYLNAIPTKAGIHKINATNDSNKAIDPCASRRDDIRPLRKLAYAQRFIGDTEPRSASSTENFVTDSSLGSTHTAEVEFPKRSIVEARLAFARYLADSATSLEELKKFVMDFNGCDLKKLANKTVFADGNPQGNIMLIGEAPGSSEDEQGIPFCGESGKLLDNVLASINISRKHNAYITNTVFWRPPANRQPTQEEVDICKPFVEKHIALINPKLIILVGNVAATSLLGRNVGISKIRQEYYLYSNQYLANPIQTTSIFHPAYLLRQPSQKKATWYDLLKIQSYLGM